MEGRSAESIDAGRAMLAQVPPPMVEQMGAVLATSLRAPVLSLVRFGRWDEVLAEPAPPGKSKGMTAIWHFARGMALAAKGQLADAQKEADALAQLVASIDEKAVMGNNSPSRVVLGVPRDILLAELAARRGQLPEAVKLYEQAVQAEDQIHYDEPPDWPLPARHYLGALLLGARRAPAAEAGGPGAPPPFPRERGGAGRAGQTPPRAPPARGPGA